MDNDSTVFVGLDVHKDSITVARVGSAATDPVIDVGTIGTRQYAIDRMVSKLSGHGSSCMRLGRAGSGCIGTERQFFHFLRCACCVSNPESPFTRYQAKTHATGGAISRYLIMRQATA